MQEQSYRQSELRKGRRVLPFFGLPKNTVLFGIVCDYDGNEEKE